ncbi:MAG: phosphodiester glycosidase family protein [Verrucomicrobiales bacterium]|nr:phosphodiester glycosidase family protein [Verrucomicrobiales bacterium]
MQASLPGSGRKALATTMLLVGVVLAAWPELRAEEPSSGATAAARPSSAGTGIQYKNDKISFSPSEPLSIHVVKVDRSRPDLVLATTLAKGTVLELGTLSDQVKAMQTAGMRPQVAINGDFYRTDREPYAGDPLGFQVMQGELVSGARTNQPCFWIDAGGTPHLGVMEDRFEVTFPSGATLPFELNEERLKETVRVYTPRLGASTQTSGGKEIVLERADEADWLPLKSGKLLRGKIREIRDQGNTKLSPDVVVVSLDSAVVARAGKMAVGDLVKLSPRTIPDTTGCEIALGGGPLLLRDGKPATYRGRNDRHPRTAFGWDDAYWYLVEVDGRQSQLSVGMTIPELSEYLQKIGVKNALNLDGGASATVWLFGQVVNSPSHGRERNTANGLVILKKDSPRRDPD